MSVAVGGILGVLGQREGRPLGAQQERRGAAGGADGEDLGRWRKVDGTDVDRGRLLDDLGFAVDLPLGLTVAARGHMCVSLWTPLSIARTTRACVCDLRDAGRTRAL